MTRLFVSSLSVLVLCGSAGLAASPNSVVSKTIQSTAQYNLRRPEVPSGSRITLFANFLGQQPGTVLLNLAGVSKECEVVQWKPESVTTELPRLGLAEPKNIEIMIILPDGRIAKKFRLLLVPQPDVVVHGETVPLPMPPSPGAESVGLAVPSQGGVLLYAQ
jgi:hypothetical protein